MRQALINITTVRGNFHLSKEYTKHFQETDYKIKMNRVTQ